MSIGKFLFYFFLLTLISGSLFWLINYIAFPTQLLIPYFWATFGFMATITLIIYLLSCLGLKIGGDHQSFILLAAIVLRLLLTLSFLLIYTQKVKVEAVLFMTNFFSLYLLFTVFEIYCLLCNLRHQIKK